MWGCGCVPAWAVVLPGFDRAGLTIPQAEDAHAADAAKITKLTSLAQVRRGAASLAREQSYGRGGGQHSTGGDHHM